MSTNKNFVLENGWVSMHGLLVYNLDSLVENTPEGK